MSAESFCHVCKHRVSEDLEDLACSEFCLVTDKATQEQFLNAQPGDWLIFPCSKCGRPVEGEWESGPAGALCTTCFPRFQLKLLTDTLYEVRSLVIEWGLSGVNPDYLDLVERIECALRTAQVTRE